MAEDLHHIQNRSLDILGLARETVEPLDVTRDSHTAHAFKQILDSEANSFPRAKLKENCELRGTRQISEHIFAAN